MVTKEERVKEIIRAKEERVKEKELQRAIKIAESGMVHISRGTRDMLEAAKILVPYTTTESALIEALERTRRLLINASEELMASLPLRDLRYK